jgi:hypothetical protein
MATKTTICLDCGHKETIRVRGETAFDPRDYKEYVSDCDNCEGTRGFARLAAKGAARLSNALSVPARIWRNISF